MKYTLRISIGFMHSVTLIHAVFYCLSGAPAARSELFQDVVIGTDAGYIFPQGNLSSSLNSTPTIGLSIGTSYYGDFRAQIGFDYCRFETLNDPLPVLFFSGGIGLEWTGFQRLGLGHQDEDSQDGFTWNSGLRWLPAPQLGVAIYTVRVSKQDDNADRYLYLHGGESEFGIYLGLNRAWPIGESWSLFASGRWDTVLTEPVYSRLFSLHFGLGYRLR
jgi:hypothetical protein